MPKIKLENGDISVSMEDLNCEWPGDYIIEEVS